MVLLIEGRSWPFVNGEVIINEKDCYMQHIQRRPDCFYESPVLVIRWQSDPRSVLTSTEDGDGFI